MVSLTARLALATYVALLAVGCKAQPGHEDPRWKYSEDDDSSDDSGNVLSPKDWGIGYPECAGSNQSPIDFIDDEDVPETLDLAEAPLEFEGDCSDFLLIPGEHEVRWLSREDGACKVRRDGREYSLTHFQLHVPSEHTINGIAYDGEVQFVHVADDDEDEQLIVSLLVEEHRTKSKLRRSTWMEAVWKSLRFVNESANIDHSYADLLLDKLQSGKSFNYAGSLTTPPCTESVDWWIVRSPLYVERTFLDGFDGLLTRMDGADDGENARETQARNGRHVTTYSDVVDQDI